MRPPGTRRPKSSNNRPPFAAASARRWGRTDRYSDFHAPRTAQSPRSSAKNSCRPRAAILLLTTSAIRFYSCTRCAQTMRSTVKHLHILNVLEPVSFALCVLSHARAAFGHALLSFALSSLCPLSGLNLMTFSARVASISRSFGNSLGQPGTWADCDVLGSV